MTVNNKTTLTAIQPEDVINGVAFIPDGIVTIGDKATAPENIERIVLPDSVNTIGCGAFNNCRNLISVKCNNVTSIGEYSFAYCEKLSEFEFTNNIRYIGRGAFTGCAFERVNVFKAIIDDDAFKECRNLVSVVSDSPIIRDHAFSGCTKLEKLEKLDNTYQIICPSDACFVVSRNVGESDDGISVYVCHPLSNINDFDKDKTEHLPTYICRSGKYVSAANSIRTAVNEIKAKISIGKLY